MASAGKQDGKKKTSSRSKKLLKPQNLDSKPGSSGSKLLESGVSRSRKVGPKKQTSQNELHLTDTPQSKIADNVNGTAKVSNNSSCKRKKALPKVRRNYSLRSLDRARILRSKLDTAKCKTTRNPASNPENLVTRKKKSGKKKVKKSGQDESSRILKHVRYMLNRMYYEQSLIDAYSGEGWKGQSVEKIRPEKELERAKSEILRCKLKIRGIFQHLDSLLAEGRLQESLFDSDGIDSESIFCGKCGSKDVSADNDIILCDGICERGFHQKCLNPPLLSEDIPTGDEGWLCPQCDCKVECIDLLSEFRGTDLSIEDSWERIFPEAAVLANGNGKYDDLNLPSDDSEDDDYDPNVQRVDVDAQEEGSGYEESESSSSSYDSTSSDDNMNQTTVELPTDDSEDDDYDPDAPDPEKEIQKSKSSSDESDFTSDSDEFCSELKKISYAEEASAFSLPSLDICVDFGRDEMKDKDKLYGNSKVLSDELEIHNQESGPMSSHKRDRERLDYKKLYDEAYGNSSSESSEDEDWNEKSSPKKLKKINDERIEEVSDDGFEEKTPKLCKRNAGYEAEKDLGPQEPHSRGFSSATVLKKSGVASKKLYEAFQENRYPTRERKESLAQELGMTFQQVTKWFGNARHSARVSANESSNFGTAASDEAMIRCDIPRSHSDPDEGVVAKSPVSSTPHANKKKLNEIFRKNQYPTREKKEQLAQELGLTFRKVSRWFETARRRSRSSAKESSNPTTSSPNKARSHKLDAGEEEDTATGAFTPERAIITSTTSTSNVKHEDGVSPRDEVTTPKSCTSPSKPDHGVASDSPIANGAASNEIGKKADEDRRKAIAKELRRMKKGR